MRRIGTTVLLFVSLSTLPACDTDDDVAGTTTTTSSGTTMSEAGCQPGEAEDAAGECVAAGLPSDWTSPGVALCAEGFELDGEGGCRPVLPSAPCNDGMMALPGETICRSVASCGSGTWGDIGVADVYVDANYGGADLDGSQSKPWLTLTQAVAAAGSGSVIAIAAGEYDGDVVVSGKTLTLWGRCPSMVSLNGTSNAGAVLLVDAGDLSLRGVAVSGPAMGISVGAGAALTVDESWVHDTAAEGLSVAAAGQATVGDSLFELGVSPPQSSDA